jgi:oligopeptide/dipeptide ABC transporter, ATP-binding protein, C-terminal domain
MITRALAGDPDLLLADEPTTALEVTTQAHILDVLRALRAERGMGLVIVSHDFGVIAEAAEEVAVMYAGRVVERAPAARLFHAPRHPYTAGLLASIPPERGRAALAALPGHPPGTGAALSACAFAPRCARAERRCREALPAWAEAEGRAAACHRPLVMA